MLVLKRWLLSLWLLASVNCGSSICDKSVKLRWVFRREQQIELLRLWHPGSAIDYFVGFDESLFLNLYFATKPFQKCSQITHSLCTTCRSIQFLEYLSLQEKITLQTPLQAFLVWRYAVLIWRWQNLISKFSLNVAWIRINFVFAASWQDLHRPDWPVL
jgi:hypothetical protein